MPVARIAAPLPSPLAAFKIAWEPPSRGHNGERDCLPAGVAYTEPPSALGGIKKILEWQMRTPPVSTSFDHVRIPYSSFAESGMICWLPSCSLDNTTRLPVLKSRPGLKAPVRSFEKCETCQSKPFSLPPRLVLTSEVLALDVPNWIEAELAVLSLEIGSNGLVAVERPFQPGRGHLCEPSTARMSEGPRMPRIDVGLQNWNTLNALEVILGVGVRHVRRPSYEVGDYKKLFDAPPQRDIARLRGSLEPRGVPARV